jgi:peptide deformylase
MILPIVAYGDQVLKKKAVDIDKDYPELEALINNMFDTMYEANGVGLAAPQIGKSIRGARFKRFCTGLYQPYYR